MRPDWAAVRGLIESVSKVDALDMTWVRFARLTESLPGLLRVQRGDAQTAEDEFRDHREGKEKR